MDKSCVARIDNEPAPTIFLEGEITTFSDEEINTAFQSLQSKPAPRIIIDFAAVKYINSAGVAILVNLVTETEKNGGKLLFSGLVAHYRRVMEIVGITEYVKLFETVEGAKAEIGESE